jgi:hypothetical protein
MHFSVGLKRRVRTLVKRLALKVPLLRRIYQERNELAARVRELELGLGTPFNIDVTGLAAAGVSSLGAFTAAPDNFSAILSSHRAAWGLEAASTGQLSELAAKTHFVTFAAGGPSFDYARRRIVVEAGSFGFASAQGFDIESTTRRWPAFSALHHFMRSNPRGYGYWIWKPFVVSHLLRELPDGDILFYCDAGSELSRYGLPVLQQMLISAERHDHLFFRMNQYPEMSWTKTEVIRHFEDELHFKVRNIGQVAATSFFIKKTDRNVALCDEWLRLSLIGNGRLIDDSTDLRQAIGFIEPRYDQSLLSCLVQKYEVDNAVDTGLCAAFRAPIDWRNDLLMLELPIFWSHRKSDTHEHSDINLRVELMRIKAYSYLASCRFGEGNPATWEALRERLLQTYRELGA